MGTVVVGSLVGVGVVGPVVGTGVVGSVVLFELPVGCIVGGLVVICGGFVGGRVVHDAQLVVVLRVQVSLQPKIQVGRHTGMVVFGLSVNCCLYVTMT